MQRLFSTWDDAAAASEPLYNRIHGPALSIDDMFDDAFPAIAHDSAGMVEVAERVQRILGELARASTTQMRCTAHRHAVLALQRAEHALDFRPDRQQVVRRHADYWQQNGAASHGALDSATGSARF